MSIHLQNKCARYPRSPTARHCNQGHEYPARAATHDSTPRPPATIPQCSSFLNLGGIHVFFAMLKATDEKNFYWRFICLLLGKTEFCMCNVLIQRTNVSLWIIHEAIVPKFQVCMLSLCNSSLVHGCRAFTSLRSTTLNFCLIVNLMTSFSYIH